MVDWSWFIKWAGTMVAGALSVGSFADASFGWNCWVVLLVMLAGAGVVSFIFLPTCIFNGMF